MMPKSSLKLILVLPFGWAFAACAAQDDNDTSKPTKNKATTHYHVRRILQTNPFDCCTDPDCIFCDEAVVQNSVAGCGAEGFQYAFDITAPFQCVPTGIEPTCCDTNAGDPCTPRAGEVCQSLEQYCMDAHFLLPCDTEGSLHCCDSMGNPIQPAFGSTCQTDPFFSSDGQFCDPNATPSPTASTPSPTPSPTARTTPQPTGSTPGPTSSIATPGPTATTATPGPTGSTATSGPTTSSTIITPAPSPSGSGTLPPVGFAGGDPHIKSWGPGDKWFDFHAECDLVLLKAPQFQQGLGLEAHIRTKLRYDYSYIERAALKIGDDHILEVASWGEYFFDGVNSARLDQGRRLDHRPGEVVRRKQINKKQSEFTLEIDGEPIVTIKSFKDMVSIKFEGVSDTQFGNSTGLLGQFGTGVMLGRDGKTVFHHDDPVAFGLEWQRLESEEQLFQSNRMPQLPDQKCKFPSSSSSSGRRRRRRLGETIISRHLAEEACSHWGDETKILCVKDILATGDMELAQAGGY